MSKVRDKSAPKLILGVCWGACAQSLAIPRQACNGGSKVGSAFHPSEVDKMSFRGFWKLSGKN